MPTQTVQHELSPKMENKIGEIIKKFLPFLIVLLVISCILIIVTAILVFSGFIRFNSIYDATKKDYDVTRNKIENVQEQQKDMNRDFDKYQEEMDQKFDNLK